MAYTDFFTSLDDLERIDWPLMGAKYWNDTQDDGDRKRRRQAEFLVHRQMPWALISGIGVMDEVTRAAVERVLRDAAHRPPVAVRSGWYYRPVGVSP